MVNFFPKKDRGRFSRGQEHDDSRIFRVPPAERGARPFFSGRTGQGGGAYRPESFVSRARSNSNILDQIKDRPVKAVWPSRAKKPGRKPEVLRNAEMSAKAAAAFSAGTRRPAQAASDVRRKAVSLTLPLLPVIGLVILGAVFFTDNRDSISSIMNRDVISVAPDSGGEASMAAFVGNTVLPAAGASSAAQPTSAAAESSSAAPAATRPPTARPLPLPAETAAAESSSVTQPSSAAQASSASQPLSVQVQAPAAQARPLSQSAAAEPVVTVAVAAVKPAVAAAVEETTAYTAIPLNMVEYFAWSEHTVLRGETVSSIAAASRLTTESVIASNNLTNAHLLRAGQKLRIPNMNGIPYEVKKGDNLSKIAAAHNIPLEVIADVNDIQRDVIVPGQIIFLPGAKMSSRDLQLAMGTYFAAPLKGARLSSNFGWRENPFGGGQRFHEAVDLAIVTGTPVKAASAGTASVVGTNAIYGKYIILDHGNGFQTLYAHLSAWSVNKGDTVKQGDKIGEVGSTGLSTGPHLHFGVYKNGNAVNPLDYYTP